MHNSCVGWVLAPTRSALERGAMRHHAERDGYSKRGAARARHGLTLIEVLMSIFVLSIGLFGVAALLPLGQKKMIEGAIDMRKAQVAEAAFQYLGTQGGLNPARWVYSNGDPFDAVLTPPVAASRTPPQEASRILCSVTASTTTSVTTNHASLSTAANAYNNCLIEFRSGTLRGQRRTISAYDGATKTFTLSVALPAPASAGNATTPPDTFVVVRARSFAIDPRLVARYGALAGTTAKGSGDAIGMPCLSLWTYGVATGSTTPAWRVMELFAAESLTMADDDLKFATPNRNDPPLQVYVTEPYNDTNRNGVCDAGEFVAAQHDMNGNGTWDGQLKRMSELNLSWIATVVPTTGGSVDQYRVSVVVFYKRPLFAVPASPATTSAIKEGPVPMEVRFTSGGLGGGAARLRARAADLAPQKTEIDPVRVGHWIIVSSGNGSEHRWYRISACGAPYLDTTDNRWTRDVTLAGADWNAAADVQANAVYYPGVVGVFERMMRIESLPDVN